ncbi:translation initiation factor SUI1 [Arcobacter sp. FWKO B]|uniref:translation initiation factor SUI1 n=1 Tax=Arcobacter sp. FWKO B TaxID=2593672 RepID=UPI0018A670E7|nr:translation initiation factor SUI1 [Arcobacter sp. FWKO B]QOG12123.1 translation initiation factor SUI1 [Arcobacter sp. FWKO B]
MKKNLFEIGAKLDSMQSDKKGKLLTTDCINKSSLSSHQEPLVFKREKRNGKVVTIVGRFVCDDDEKKKVLKLLKTKLGCGGTIDSEWLELQGELQEKVKVVLSDNGWKFRK